MNRQDLLEALGKVELDLSSVVHDIATGRLGPELRFLCGQLEELDKGRDILLALLDHAGQEAVA